jgi:tetratricopeptide (TPR) repeat protein
MNIENQHTLQKALAEGINLFLGAGFSVLAKDAAGTALPVGGQLTKELTQEFNLTETDGLSLPQLCTILESEREGQLREYLRQRFTVRSFDSRYGALAKMAIRTVFTTNIDDLLYKIYAEVETHYINDVTSRGAAFGERTAIDYVPLHGSVVQADDKFTFSATDLATAFSSDPDRWHLLTGSLQAFPTLFWGYSLADAGTLQAISSSASSGRPHQEKWMCLRTADAASSRYFKALGFHIIVADTRELLDYLGTLTRPMGGTGKVAKPTATLFREYAIPPAGTVPVRPLRDFYLGAAPSWSDIYSNALCKTSHYGAIVESINSGKHTVVLGIPACGKTTLMMQVAAGYPFRGHKLVCDALTVEKAEVLCRHIGDDPGLIFLDNCSDSIDALNMLAAHPKLSVVGFDRDHNYETGSHKIKVKLNILGITDLTPKDQQDVVKAIPSSLRRPRFIQPNVEAGVTPSLYELLQANLTAPSLHTRYHNLLRKLGADQAILHDYLVMCSYVHSCRTPVSFDMALAFLRGTVTEATGVYDITTTVASLIPDYVGELADSEQDYFMPRSTFVSEAILDEVAPEALRRVLLRFHSNVTPYRICRFDIFRRRAFSADLAKRAFPNWEEGQAYYDRLYQRDKSPYLLQQAALYSASKSRYSEAFALIDKAVLEAGPKVFSIRNSHAIILFEANIRHAVGGDEQIRATLDRSLAILTDCHAADMRKQYHAVKFGDLALRYWDVYGDTRATRYLDTAREWLREEASEAPWNRSIKRILDRVEKARRA